MPICVGSVVIRIRFSKLPHGFLWVPWTSFPGLREVTIALAIGTTVAYCSVMETTLPEPTETTLPEPTIEQLLVVYATQADLIRTYNHDAACEILTHAERCLVSEFQPSLKGLYTVWAYVANEVLGSGQVQGAP